MLMADAVWDVMGGAEAAKEDVSGTGLKKAVYNGVDITSKASVDHEIKK